MTNNLDPANRRASPDVGFDFREVLLAQRRRRLLRQLLTFASVFLGVFVVGMATTNWSSIRLMLWADRSEDLSIKFERCSAFRLSCVIDGDTIRLHGQTIRIADIDTPEIFSPQCESELQLGLQATERLQELLSAGPFVVEPIAGRKVDIYGRQLRVLTRDGSSIGDQLVREGLARTWKGSRDPWC